MEEAKGQQKQLSEQEIAYLNALDPHALVSTKPWEMEVKSAFLRKVALFCVVVVMVIHIFVGATLDIEFTGATITTIDKFALPGVGVVISVLAWLAFTRPRMRANEDGVEVRNIIGTRFYSWYVIYGLSFPEGARMARLELPEFEYVPIWAMQSADGTDTIDNVKRFRELEAKYMPQD